MGTSLAGICVNHSFDKDGFDLGRDLELYWKFQKEVGYDKAFEKNKKNGIYDVCFLEKGTIIFTELETGMWGRTSEKHEVFSFVIQESTMSFSFRWSDRSEFEQRYFRLESGKIEEDVCIGEKLPIENEFDDYTQLIEAQIKQTTGCALTDLSDKKFYRFKWVGANVLLKEFDYALRSGYLFRFSNFELISQYTTEEQKRLFEIYHQHAVENKIDVFHYIIGGDSEGKTPPEFEFQMSFKYLIQEILLPNPETKPLVEKYYTQKQLDWLFSIDPNDTELYLDVLNDHLPKQKDQTPDQPHPNKRDHSPKKWWEFWR